MEIYSEYKANPVCWNIVLYYTKYNNVIFDIILYTHQKQ